MHVQLKGSSWTIPPSDFDIFGICPYSFFKVELLPMEIVVIELPPFDIEAIN